MRIWQVTKKTEFDRHDYLTRMIEGYDIDKFASEVARLSLLLYSLPYGNKWDIHAGDLLRISKSKNKGTICYIRKSTI